MAGAGLNSYLYAPKDDPKHRLQWFTPYTRREAAELSQLLHACEGTSIRFIYGLAPGFRAEFSPAEMERFLRRKISQLVRMGARSFALLFDDIPPEGSAQNLRRYGSWAGAHVTWTHQVLAYLQKEAPGASLLFCPTPYSGSFAGDVGSNRYLAEIGERLDSSIPVFWTGQDIVSRALTVAELRHLRGVLRRPPILWDNLFANDYDLRRLNLGPYADREPGIRSEVSGILLNPNCEFRANFVPLHTFASFVSARGSWTVERAYEAAVEAWRPAFRDYSGTLPSRAELRVLTDCLHLPYTLGPAAEELLAATACLLQTGRRPGSVVRCFQERATQLARWHGRITEMVDRDLGYTLYRHVWELKEELDLLQRYVAWQQQPRRGRPPFRSIFHQPGTYRGGLAAQLQQLLRLTPEGEFQVTPPNDV